MFTAAILTISDKGASGQRVDRSGPAIQEVLLSLGGSITRSDIVPDEPAAIQDRLRRWADEGLDLIITTGGTGVGPRDITPEATLAVVDRLVPGIAEAMRAEGLKVTPHAMLSRAVAGVRGRCLIINLPGSPKAVREGLAVVRPALQHAIELLRGEFTEHPPA
ncbi:MAG: MogA/MoaB family molybdenum cofactor biosynthesis protein [Chloroflexi bacterium]|nr:MogA/MoaB family molybdenum cofactor biosynthesis protein [Chloroflexota bacterium]